MTSLKQKLQTYYENNLDYEQSEAFVERMKSLETDRAAAAMPPRRRWLIPVAALIALALLLGSGWAWYRSIQPDRTPENAVQIESGTPAHTKPEAPVEKVDPIPEKPAEPKPAKPEVPAPDEAEGTEPVQQDAPAPAKAYTPAPETSDAPKPPEQTEPETAEPPVPPAQDGPASEDIDIPEPEDPDPPATIEPDVPAPEDPNVPAQAEPDAPAEPLPEPEPVTPQMPDFDAVYRLSGDRELLTMTLLSTGESVEVDVTGWEQQAPSAEAPAYTGSNPVVNFIFEKEITYRLTREDDGTVRVDLDVDDAETERSGKGEEP